MGLKGDISELATVWQGAPWRIKLYLLLSGFLATSSIASLAEVISKWKGFIFAGIAFYRDYFRDPFFEILQEWTPIHLSPAYGDTLTIYALAMAALSRGYILEMKTDRSRSGRISTCIVLAFMAVMFGWLVYVACSLPRNTPPNITVPAVSYLLIVFSLQLPPRGAWKLLATVYLIVPPLLVCFAAAVNLGLNEPAPV